jgi:hypothetical protein
MFILKKNDKKVKVTCKIVIFTKYIRELGFTWCRTEAFAVKEEYKVEIVEEGIRRACGWRGKENGIWL